MTAAAIAERRARPGEDLLSKLIAEADAGNLSGRELVANAWGLYAAGHETTAQRRPGNAGVRIGQIGDALLTLIRHPDQLALLRADMSLSLSPKRSRRSCATKASRRQCTACTPADVRVGEHVIPAERSTSRPPTEAGRSRSDIRAPSSAAEHPPWELTHHESADKSSVCRVSSRMTSANGVTYRAT